jgi:hypothetical protein
MVTLPTVSSFFYTCGCFLRDGPSSSRDLPPLSLACGWPLSANGSLCEWRRLQDIRVEDPSGARKGGRNDPLRSCGYLGDYALCPFHCMIFTMSSSRPRWRFSVHEVRSFTLQSPGVFLRSTSVVATIGSDFIKLMNTNKTP